MIYAQFFAADPILRSKRARIGFPDPKISKNIKTYVKHWKIKKMKKIEKLKIEIPINLWVKGALHYENFDEFWGQGGLEL